MPTAPLAAYVGDADDIIAVSAAHDWVGSACASRFTIARISGESSVGPAVAVPTMVNTIVATAAITAVVRPLTDRPGLRHQALALMRHSSADNSTQIAQSSSQIADDSRSRKKFALRFVKLWEGRIVHPLLSCVKAIRCFFKELRKIFMAQNYKIVGCLSRQ